MEQFLVSYDELTNTGLIKRSTGSSESMGWSRLQSSALAIDPRSTYLPDEVVLPWHYVLKLLREYSPLQRQLQFKFITDGSSKDRIARFIRDIQIYIAGR